jgi:uncharacterized protein involved in outer membrane biogenesis
LRASDAKLDNEPGGSRPDMAEFGLLIAEIDALSLLRGPIMVRRLELTGLRLLLERDAQHKGNWAFGAPSESAATTDTGRAGFPTLLDARLRNAEIDFRTTSGTMLRIRLEDTALIAADTESPVRLTARGSYNDAPAALEAGLGPYRALRDETNSFPVDLSLRSGEAVVHFQGGMTDPLNVDGARGRLTLETPSLDPVLRIAGLPADPGTPSLRLDGAFDHQGNRWHWAELKGALGKSDLTGGELTLIEGSRDTPDAITAALDFDRLDLDALLDRRHSGGGEADMSLAVDRAPGTLVSLRLAARRLEYGLLDATAFQLVAALKPGRITVEELALVYLGGRITAKGQVEHERIQASTSADGVQADALRRAVGLGQFPISGRLDGRFALDARGATLNAAVRAAHGSAVLRMQGGRIARRVLEIASTDLRSLFRAADGSSPVTCLLAVVDLRGSEATVAPLRIRAGEGTIAGNGSFNLRRRLVDLTIGSQPDTTGTLALDVPVRLSGSLDNPTIRPARWSAEGRALLSAPNVVGRLLPALQPFAQESPCLGW